MFARIRNWFRVPYDTELWGPQGAGYSPNETNGVLGRVHDDWSVEPSAGSDLFWEGAAF